MKTLAMEQYILLNSIFYITSGRKLITTFTTLN